jgi:DNA polymerase III epsilon subunit-like protein
MDIIIDPIIGDTLNEIINNVQKEEPIKVEPKEEPNKVEPKEELNKVELKEEPKKVEPKEEPVIEKLKDEQVIAIPIKKVRPKMLTEKVKSNFQAIYDKIKGKKVFIFDLETTGLFNHSDFFKYWKNKVFDTARIVEIGYYYSDKFGEDDVTTVHSYLRKPTDFTKIDPIAESKHGLSMDKLNAEGYTFSKILNADLMQKLSQCEIIISHNTAFDFYILLNELCRFKLSNTLKYMLNIRKSKNLICTCRASGFKKLEDLYELIFNKKPDVSHRAGDDVKTLVEIILKKHINFDLKTSI